MFSCRQRLAAIVIGILGLASSAGAALPPNAARMLIASWETDVGLGVATYTFDAAGNFSLTFDGQLKGHARGKWQLQGDVLTMENQVSDTRLTVVGEKETAQIVGLDDRKLMLKTTDGKGRPEVVTLMKVVDPAAFPKGKAENPKVVGIFRMRGAADTIALIADGSAVFSYQQRTCIGQWSQTGGDLQLRTKDLRDLGEMIKQQRRVGGAATRPAVGYGSGSTTMPSIDDASRRDPFATAQPTITGVYALPPVTLNLIRNQPPATTRPSLPATRPAASRPYEAPETVTFTPYIVELTYGVQQVTDNGLTLRMTRGGRSVDVEWMRVQP